MHKFLVRRIMALTLSICMIAGMIDLSGFKVYAANVTLAGGTITLASTAEAFTGSEIKPGVTSVTDLAGNPVDSAEYEVSYQNNTNVGRATVTVTNKQNPSDTNTAYFMITARDIAQCTIGNIEEQFLPPGGGAVTPQITVTDPGRADLTLTSADYTYTFTDNTAGGTATVTVSGRGNYGGSTSKTFTITELVSEKLTFILPDGNVYGYIAGTGVEPEVSDVKYDNKVLSSDQYVVRYEGNRVAADNTAKAIVEGRGRYTGLKSEQTFTVRKSLNGNYGTSSITVGTISPQSFKGDGQPVTLTEDQIPVNDPDLGPLQGGVDFEIDASTYQNHTQESTDSRLASVVIKGKGKYSGSKEVTYKIEAARLEAEMVTIDDSMCKYDGTTNWYEKLKVKVSSGTIEYVQGTDYDIAPVDNGVLAGTHYITITPKGKLKGDAVRKLYTVKQRELTDATMTFIEQPNYTYDGTAKRPGIQIIYKQGDGTDYTLRAGIDYESQLSYGNNINASKPDSQAEVWAVGKGNFTGESNHLSFDIKPVEMTSSNTQITGIPTTPVTYTGNEITFNNLNVRVNGRALTLNTDYTVRYENNINVGTNAAITIEGKGNYQGTFREGFTITECSLTDTRVITIDAIPAQQYEGEDRQITPEVTVKHSGRVLVENTDYTLEYGENIKVGQGSVTIIGMGNYKDRLTRNFSIIQRNIGTGELLVNDDASNYDYNTMSPDEIYYEYNGKNQEPELRVTYNNVEASISNLLVKGTDYDITFSRNKDIGTAQFVIQAKGNYTGTKTFNFTIKGNLADYGTGESAYTQITIPDQIYTSNPIVPSNAEVKFNGKLLTSSDYTIECSNNTDAGTGTALADITGTGFYFGKAQGVPFNILPLDLSNDPLEENGYIISGVETNYIYSGFPVRPVPSIAHNGNPLSEGVAYRVEYDEEGVDNVNVSKDGKKGKLVIYGIPDNYIGSHDVEFSIDPYDIGIGKNGGYNNGSNIEVEDLVKDVIWDRIKDTTGVAMSEYNPDAVVQTELKVYYTGVGLDGSTASRRLLDPDTEYTVEYENNETIGTAAVIIKGKGNFTGEIREEFKIRGDLSADSTTLEVKDCVYSPAGADGKSTNIPEHKVTYTITRSSGAKVSVELVEGTDYVAEYENNENATVNGTPAQIKILPVMENGVEIGNYTGEKSAEYQIEQRDLSAAIESEGIAKDPDLDVTGLIEEGYEYTGEKIVPQIQVSCKGTNLSPIFEGDTDTTIYDYVISAINNTNVYEYGEDSHGEKERLYPTVTVTAKQDENGAFTGNYKGSFQMKFQINPRVISVETVDTIEPVSGMENEMDYTGDPVTFPLISEEPEDAGKNAIRVTWSKEGENGTVRTPLVEGQDYQIIYKDNVKIGEAKVIISAINESNYTGEYEKPFKIMASIEVVDQENPPLKYMSLKFDENVPFGIVDVYPEMIFQDYSGVLCGETNEPKILVEGEDFEVVTEDNQGDTPEASRNNTNVASKDDEDEAKRPLVVIRGKGCYRGVIKRYYNIIPKDLAADQGDITAEFIGSTTTEEYENAYIYTGEEIRPEIRVYNHGQLMIPDVDYTVEGYVNNREISTEENPAGVVIKAVEGGNYLNQKTLNFNIIRRPIAGMEVTITGGPQIFNRQEKQPEVEVSYMDGTNKIVLTKEDYDIAYENNVNAATEFIGDDAPLIIITGKGAYGGELRKKFTILPESFELAEDQEDDFDIRAENAIYTGKPVTTTIEVKAKDGTLLVEGEDYELGAYTDNTNIGTGTIAISGKGNYTGTRQVPFRIVPAEGRIRVEEIPDQTYNSLEITPKPQVFFKVENVEGIEDMEFPLTEGEDYELSYTNNINAGTASITVTGTGNFPGRETVNFTILPKSISRDVSGDDGLANDMILGDIEDQLYTGRGVTPDVDISYRRSQRSEDDTDLKLILNRDYTLNYTQNVAVGMAEVSITGIGNYKGTVRSNFRILGTMNLASIADIPVQQYTGAPVTPKPQISFTGTELIENTDYMLEYENNVERGTATITITGMGWYTGTRTVNFDIAREFSEETMVRGIAAAYTYTGAAIAPAVRVEDNGTVLTNGTDYQVSYSANTNVGTATITVTGINKYSGSRSVTFKIVPQNISRASVTNVMEQTYTGKDIKPAVQVKNGGTVLSSGTDYKISYVDNKYPGTGRVIIRGDGNYTGTQTVIFNIIVPEVTGVKASKYTTSSITFSWTRNKVVGGYEIYNSKNKLQVRLKKNSTVKATVKNLKAGTVSTFKIRAFVIKGGRYHYSEFVKIKTGTAPKVTSITGINSSRSKQVVVKWKKIKGASTYQIYRSTSKKGKYTRIASTSKNVYTDKKAKGGKMYYYKIRVGKKSGSTTYYSSYSQVKSIKAKK